jgi:diaminobutyrate-2-oxoglutarate transaminase
MKMRGERESRVRYYSRSIDRVFTTGDGPYVVDIDGNKYIDFFCAAGSLSMGHSPKPISEAVIKYLAANGIISSLDLNSVAKIEFIESFDEIILKPRKLDYLIQFTGPTGTNAVEAALKLARLYTGRVPIVAFTNGFHGASLGALSATGSSLLRSAAGLPLDGVIRMPYEGYSDGVDGISYLDQLLHDRSSGIDAPAAFIVETIQAEGGVNVASAQWLNRLAALARKVGALLIIDDVQVGCGRSGTFFSFENMNFTPDIVCLSKAIGGMGFPMALVLMRPELDVWQPGGHNGTFRGNNTAFVASKALLANYWSDVAFTESLSEKCKTLDGLLGKVSAKHGGFVINVKGRGFIRGVLMESAAAAEEVQQEALKLGLLVETCGPNGEVIKLLPPLNSSNEILRAANELLDEAITRTQDRQGLRRGRIA